MESSNMLSKKVSGGLFAAMLGVLSISGACAQTLLDVGGLGGGYSVATGINDSGQVVGQAETSSGFYDAFLYANGTTSNLGIAGISSAATGINSSGQIVGSFSTRQSDGSISSDGFIYSNGTETVLGTLPRSTDSSYATAINNSGQAVGYSYTGINPNAFIYSNGTLSYPASLAGAFSNAINDSGQVVGRVPTSGDTGYGFLYSNGTVINLGTLAGDANSSAIAINNSGMVVGYSFNNGPNGSQCCPRDKQFRNGGWLFCNEQRR
jgi:probable HAF family extracellular repeat protein